MPRRILTAPTQDGDCLIWQGSVDGYGHPLTSVKGRVVRAKYLIFERQHGYRPQAITTSCGNKLCVNPSHLLDSNLHKAHLNAQAELSSLLPRISTLQITIENLKDATDLDSIAHVQLCTEQLKGLLQQKQKAEEKLKER